MQILGIVGGIASGKSAVSADLAALGAVVLDADRTAHEVINLPEVKQKLVERWGSAILRESGLGELGEIDRSAVAKRVFSGQDASKAELQFLEQTLHPTIRQQFEKELGRLTQQGVPAAVIDAPLLLEAGWRSLCKEVIFVDSSRETRLRRAQARGWSEEEFSRREQAQMPIEEKRVQATQILANEGSREALRALVHGFWESFVSGSS